MHNAQTGAWSGGERHQAGRNEAGPRSGPRGLDAITADGFSGPPVAAPEPMQADVAKADSWLRKPFDWVGDTMRTAWRAARSAVGAGNAPGARGSKTVDEFLDHAFSQSGTRYLLGGKANSSNGDPKEIDCSGLIQWAAGRAGGRLNGGSWQQAQAMKPFPGKTKAQSVNDALLTRGAILYKPGHIGISLGNGMALEANPGLGVMVVPAVGRGWTQGGLVPGLKYDDV